MRNLFISGSIARRPQTITFLPLKQRRLKPRRRIPICSDRETIPSFYSSSSSSSNDFEIREIPSDAVTSEELKLDFEASVEDSDVTESTKDLISLTTEEEEDNDFDVISFSVDMEGSDSGQDRVDPVQEEAKTEESTVIDDRRDDYKEGRRWKERMMVAEEKKKVESPLT